MNTSLGKAFKTASILIVSVVTILKYLLTSYLFHCSTYTNKRMTLMDKIKSINCYILEWSDAVMTKNSSIWRLRSNSLLLNLGINYVISTNKFYDSI